MGLDGEHHGRAGAGDGELVEDCDVVGGKVLLDAVVPEEYCSSNAVGV